VALSSFLEIFYCDFEKPEDELRNPFQKKAPSPVFSTLINPNSEVEVRERG